MRWEIQLERREKDKFVEENYMPEQGFSHMITLKKSRLMK
jgi:hypothetical protein